MLRSENYEDEIGYLKQKLKIFNTTFIKYFVIVTNAFSN